MSRFGHGPQSSLLARLNFPPYVIQVVGERHVLVAGGGGSSKTGVRNNIEVYELSRNDDSCIADCIGHKDTGDQAIMNGTIFRRDGKMYLAGGGMDGKCKLFLLSTRLFTPNGNNIGNGHSGQRDRHSSGSFSHAMLRRRNSSTSSDRPQTNGSVTMNGNSTTGQQQPDMPQITFEMRHIAEFAADFDKEPFLKFVRYSPKLDILVTGGADGHFRIWNLDDLSSHNQVPKSDVSAHSDEIDDLDVDPTGGHIATVSRDGKGYVWECGSNSQPRVLFNLELMVASNTPVKYKFRNCRFSPRINHPKLYTTSNPVVRKDPADSCYLCKWDTSRKVIEQKVNTGKDPSSNLTMSDDGKFLGLGTLGGGVSVYSADNLRRLYRVNHSHTFFVTGLQFLKCTPVTQIMSGDNEASLVSISVDNKIVVHHIPKTDPLSFLESSFLFVATLIAVFILIDLLGL